MRLGLLGDIHGNRDALAAVLDAAKRRGVEQILCSGDFVGYYYQPEECLELLRPWSVESVRGNHEDALLQLTHQPTLVDELRVRYGSGHSVALRTLSPLQLQYLRELPSRTTFVAEDKTVLLCHGSPEDTNEYVYPDAGDAAFRRCAESGMDYIVMGHTHYQHTRRAGSTMLINPGSVGQPRDRKPGAAWALLDSETGACEHFTEPYDVAPVIAQARLNDPHLPYLWEVLSRQ